MTPSRTLGVTERTAEEGGIQPFGDTAANGEVAPKAAVPPVRKNQAVFYEADFWVLARGGFRGGNRSTSLSAIDVPGMIEG